MYATVADLRAEGVTTLQASDQRLESLIEEACAWVDHVTGWFFEPRPLIVRMSGRGTPGLEPLFPPIKLTALIHNGQALPLDPDSLLIVGAPVLPGFEAPRLTRLRGLFCRGADNVVAAGMWGYTELDGTAEGRTPLAIRRVVIMLVMRLLTPAGESGGSGASLQWRIIEERTRDQSYKLAAPVDLGISWTGDPDIDRILARYRRPQGLGAA